MGRGGDGETGNGETGNGETGEDEIRMTNEIRSSKFE
jgi:hypothetical protein